MGFNFGLFLLKFLCFSVLGPFLGPFYAVCQGFFDVFRQSKLESRLQSCFFFFLLILAFLTLISAVVKS